ncbi:hypothetical protein [Streptomyces sp. WMMC897]|uniref:hypothetical protein n=1 Tax=Streptomyces sp. WMMC897 TaxID=3014782 RepID=UPI0022B6EEA8|nr:hypothetical protein [Streptomyces sp. WMMC897]MCZ7413040.1 hypothetical protein [Streptomyces sp. WMMC897]MCZ7413078.1 hypothetical protein [Streptomyces sp. WMMC897]MCZ7415450.1 hypothetical protein [Streptomyces sp. WMMC897]
MMRIRMVVDMPPGAARDGQPWPARGVPVELPTAEAAHLVASGVAEEAPEEVRADEAGEPQEAGAPDKRSRRKPTKQKGGEG